MLEVFFSMNSLKPCRLSYFTRYSILEPKNSQTGNKEPCEVILLKRLQSIRREVKTCDRIGKEYNFSIQQSTLKLCMCFNTKCKIAFQLSACDYTPQTKTNGEASARQ